MAGWLFPAANGSKRKVSSISSPTAAPAALKSAGFRRALTRPYASFEIWYDSTEHVASGKARSAPAMRRA